jgi:hypothetical protein
MGLLLLLFTLFVIVWSWKRAPVIAFGLTWCAIALFPVHNVLVSTGIVLAERTLFLASVGVVIALGGLGELLLRVANDRGRIGLLSAVGALLILGVYRSTIRHPFWSDQFTFWYQTANRDAPLSYRAHHALAELYWGARLEGRAEREYRLAIANSPPKLMQVGVDYANRLRIKGLCYPALPYYRAGLEVHPNFLAWRASFVACLLHEGKYQEARTVALLGATYEYQVESWRRIRHTADSALRVGAPPGSVTITLPATDSIGTHMGIGTGTQ